MFNNYYNFIGNNSSIGILINETTKTDSNFICDIITFYYVSKSKEKEFIITSLNENKLQKAKELKNEI